MQGPEKVVCCTLCLCMAVAVLSSCSLVYLTFIVYLPAQKELMSGLLDRPVMCTTEERTETDECEWDVNDKVRQTFGQNPPNYGTKSAYLSIS